MVCVRRSAFLAAAAGLLGGAAGLRQRAQEQDSTELCGKDAVNFAQIALNSNRLNEGQGQAMEELRSVGERSGCWEMLAYNSDKSLSSILYQNRVDGRCVLGLSGQSPKGTVIKSEQVCGVDVFYTYAPFVRQHTALANWTNIARSIAGEGGACRGDVAMTAESGGGAAAELLAFCGNSGMLGQLQDPNLPNFTTDTLYTFGAPPATTKALKNPLRPDGCFKGKRVFFHTEKSQWTFLVKHPRMDAVEVFADGEPSVKVYPCDSREAVSNPKVSASRPPAMSTKDTIMAAATQLSVARYHTGVRFMHEHGLGELFDHKPVSERPAESTVGRWLAMQKQMEA